MKRIDGHDHRGATAADSPPAPPRGHGVSAWLLPALAAVCTLLAVVGLVLAGTPSGSGWAAPLAIGGIVGCAVALAAWPLLQAILRPGSEERVRRLLEEQTRLLSQIHEHTMLSDGGKRVIYRSNELQLLRCTIEEDMRRGDYDAALTLCGTMAEEFGYREEAERFRESIESSRRDEYEQQVRDATSEFDEALARRDWTRAHQEAARIRRLFPDASIVAELDLRIAKAREEHKQGLTERFLASANHGEVENAMSLLRELDRYLTRPEAQQLREVANGVVSRHRENLSVQFNIAVRDRAWAEAVRIGNDIVREFPNSKMADEVRSMLEVLRHRATQAAVHSDQG